MVEQWRNYYEYFCLSLELHSIDFAMHILRPQSWNSLLVATGCDDCISRDYRLDCFNYRCNDRKFTTKCVSLLWLFWAIGAKTDFIVVVDLSDSKAQLLSSRREVFGNCAERFINHSHILYISGFCWKKVLQFD